MCGINKLGKLAFYTNFIKLISILIFSTILSACSKNIVIKDAYISNATAVEAGTRSMEPHLQVNMVLPREAVQKIASNELYIYIHVVNCTSGEIKAVTEARLDGARIDRFEDLRLKLKKSSQDFFMLTGNVSEPTDWRNTCATLDGGSYFLGKVRSERVPLRWRASA
jgi:hypothetical protein